MAVRIVQLGTARQRREGLRIGTVRRPPRGVPKAQHASQDWYDVWLPNLAPSTELMADRASIGGEGRGWPAFERRFRAELKRPDAAHLLDVLAALSHVTNFSIGCYCDDERRCHRSVLRNELKERGADVV